MVLTLDLDQTQTAVLSTMFDTMLRTLVLQESILKDELEQPGLDPEEAVKLNDYLLLNVAPQRALTAEILYNIKKAEDSRIIVPTI